MLLWLWIIPLAAGHPLGAGCADTKVTRQALVEALEPTFARADLDSNSYLDSTEYISVASFLFAKFLQSYSSDETKGMDVLKTFQRSLLHESCWSCYQSWSSPAKFNPQNGRSYEAELSASPLTASTRQMLSATNSSLQPFPTALFPPPSAPVRDSVVNITNSSLAEDELEMAITTPHVATVLLSTSIQLTQSLSTVSRSLSIDGSCASAAGGCEIDGNHSVRIFLVDGREGSVQLQLTGLILRAGYSASEGGAIYSFNWASLSLYNSTVQNSFAETCGGGVYLANSRLLASQSAFISNSAGEDGGGIHAVGASIRVQNTSLSQNRAGSCGGAIYGCNQTAILLEDHSAVMENAAVVGGGVFGINWSPIIVRNHSALCSNSAVEEGGGIYAENGCAVAVHAASAVCGNTAANNGGGISIFRGQVNVTSGSVITGNFGKRGGGIYAWEERCAFDELVVFLSDSAVHSNNCSNRGGGIMFDTEVGELLCGTKIKLEHSSLYGNYAERSGGAVYSHASVEMGNCTVSNNTALNIGGGLCCEHEHLVVTDESTLSGNSAGTSGGGFSAVSLQMSSTVVTANAAEGSGGGGFLDRLGNISHCTFTYNQGGYRGGALAFNIRSQVYLYDSLLAGNFAVYSHGGALSAFQSCAATIEGSILRDNSSPQDGGGIYMDVGAVIHLSRSTLEHNTAGEGGGAVTICSDSILKVKECTLAENQGREGGAIYSSGSTVIRSSQLDRNTAAEGGAMFMAPPRQDDRFKYVGCYVDKPVRALHLPALPSMYMSPSLCAELCYGFEYFGTQSAEECFCGSEDYNRYGPSGGCDQLCSGDRSVVCGGNWANSVYRMLTNTTASRFAEAQILETVLSANVATRGSGGAVHVLSSTLELTNGTKLRENECVVYGGGVYAQGGTVRLLNGSQGCSVSSNMAGSGGGISVMTNATLDVEEMAFTENLARQYGGAMACSYSTCILRGVVGTENVADDHGGFMYLLHSDGVMEQATLQHLHAGAGGGVYGTDSTASLSDVHLLMCQAESSGAGVFMRRSSLSMRNTTIEKCEGNTGGAVTVGEGTELHIANSSFLNNSVASGTGGALSLDEAHAAVDRVLFEDNRGDDAGAVTVGDGGVLAMSASVLSRNRAFNGGGLACTAQCSLDLRNVSFVGNRATQWGGGIFLQWPNINYTIAMHGLNFSECYAAAAGSHIFWKAYPATPTTELHPGTAVPSCSGCDVGSELNVTALMASTALDFTVSQSSGGSTEAVAAIVCESSLIIDPPLVYHAWDYYGAPTLVAESSYVNAISSSESYLLSGGMSSVYLFVGAIFDYLVAAGTPGHSFNITLASSLQSTYAWQPVTVRATLAPCLMGEVYDAKLKVCTECSPGTIKFNNDTAACSGCDAVPEGSLTCPGGSNFTVGQGAWIAPNAQHCPDAACFLNRVYECEVAEACENGNEAQRSGSQLADAVGLQAELCSPEHYSGPDTVVCGGHVPVVCRARQFRVSTQDRCQPCPAVVSLLASVIGCLLLMIGVIMLLLWIFGASTHSAEANSSTALMDMTQDMAIQAQKLSGMLSLVLGYLQVMSQLTQVYDAESMPPLFGQLLGAFGIFAMDITFFVNSKCLLDAWLPYKSVDFSFWCEFYLTQSSPLLILLCFSILIVRHHLRLRLSPISLLDIFTFKTLQAIKNPKIAEDAHALKQQASAIEDDVEYRGTCIAATIFMLMLLHPTLSTSSLMIFKCKEYYYDSADYESHQEWLHMNIHVECYSTDWKIGAAFASFSLLTFTLGFPLYIYRRMQDLRCFVQVSVRCADLERHSDLLKSNLWRLVDQLDILQFKRDGPSEVGRAVCDEALPDHIDYTLNPLSAAYEEEIQGNDAILLFSPEDSMQSRPPVAIGAHVDLMVHSSTVDGLVDEALPEASTFEDLSDWDTCPMSVAIVDDGSYLDIDALAQLSSGMFISSAAKLPI
ncbi:hypothetical protein CYMTET_20605 [Cymbomonas tetramitiformis]|uniref:WSC domain-containing protein n=1 Tax=Cymbomonas tetramitiformis TaxID=36881 RepID=A0AAE0L3T5_9CHLO|nr:hypothetical protein CYMTET_20605 [Cymbomonas tetramitiformis]